MEPNTQNGLAETEISSLKKLLYSLYERIPHDKRDLDLIRNEIKIKNPELFDEDFFDISLGGFEKQEDVEKFFFTKNNYDAGADITEGDFETILKEGEEKFENILSEIKSRFGSYCSINSRIKEFGSLEKKIKQSSSMFNTDIWGIRVVPHSANKLPNILFDLKKEWGNRISFNINTFSYSNEKIERLMGYNSRFYRAIHCYVPVNNFFIEIQARTPNIDTWSSLHHKIIYKPDKPATKEEIEIMDTLGEIANVIDCYDLLA